jgi:putative ABC transport system substrate-binding protein
MMLIARLAAAAVFLAGATACLAQPAVKVFRVGVVSPLAGTPEPPTVRAFRQGMRELGYVEGKNVVFEIRYAEGRSERLPELFAELINLKVDLLLTGSVLGALAAKKATTSVPIVFAGLGDALSSGIVPSLARPGGNITGAHVRRGRGGYDRETAGTT